MKRFFWYILIVYGLVFQPCYGFRIIDISVVSFSLKNKNPQEKHPYVRYVDFHVLEQKFLKIEYIPFQNAQALWNLPYCSLRMDPITQELEVHITASPKSNSEVPWILCAPCKVQPDGDTLSTPLDLDPQILGRALINPLEASYLPASQCNDTFFNKFTQRRSKGNTVLKGTFWDPSHSIPLSIPMTGEGGLSILLGAHQARQELGRLGELATDLTFLAHGFKKVTLKLNNADHGFDGIYLDKPTMPTIIWITESKYHHGAWSPHELMNNLLKKLQGAGSLEKYQQSTQETHRSIATLIGRFKQDHPNTLYLLGQSVLKDGTIKSVAASYNAHYSSDLPLQINSEATSQRFITTYIALYKKAARQGGYTYNPVTFMLQTLQGLMALAS